MLAALAVQRRSNQVTHAFAGMNVLGREKPVIAGQAHAATQCHRLVDETGAKLACCGRRMAC